MSALSAGNVGALQVPVRVNLSPALVRGAAGCAVALLVWEAVARLGVFAEATLPTASAVLATMAASMMDGAVWEPMFQTLRGWAQGLFLVVVTAVPLGVLIGRVELVYRGLRPVFEFLRPIPGVTFLPLLLLMFGPTITMKTWMVALAAFWPLLFQTYYGVKAVEPVTIETARVFQIGPIRRAWKVMLPATLPFIATGFRISSAIALIVAVVSELIGGAPGLGERIFAAQVAGTYASMYAYIGFAGALGVLLNAATRRVERRVLAWHVVNREQVT